MIKLTELYKFIHLLIHGSNAETAASLGVDIFIFSIVFAVLYVMPFIVWHYFSSTYNVTKTLVKLLVLYFNILIRIIREFLSLMYIHIYVLVVIAIIIFLWLVTVYLDPFNDYSLEKTAIVQSSIVTDANDNIMDYIFDDTIRIWAPMNKIDAKAVSLILFSEDDKFYKHSGFDIVEIFASLKKNFIKKCYARGGSTITQQLAKNAFLTKEKSIKRKLREFAISLKLETRLSKEEIIHMYLNLVEWGPGIYGIESASRYYFDRPAESLTLAQCYFLALILPNPKFFSPFYNPQNMKKIRLRQRSLARRLFFENQISREEWEKQQSMSFWFYLNRSPKNLLSVYPKLDSENREDKLPLFAGLEKYLVKKLGEHLLYRRGMKIKLTLDKQRQSGVMETCNRLNRLTDYNSNDLNFIPITQKGRIIAVAPLASTTPENIKTLMNDLQKGEKPGKIYTIGNMPWKRMIASSEKLPAFPMKK
ncbi:MAG: penicillin-binding protein [Oligoflexia bacterium]|nr:penicillin-binding protein [Oligoflexia bacterium]